MLFKTGHRKIAVVIDDGPSSMRVRIDAIGAQAVAGIPRARYKLLDAAEVHINGIDPAARLIPCDQDQGAVSEFFRKQFVAVVAQGEHIRVGLLAIQVSHARQPEDVTRQMKIGVPLVDRILLAPTIHIEPAGVDGLREGTQRVVLRRAVVGAAEDLGSRAMETIQHRLCRSRLVARGTPCRSGNSPRSLS